MSLAYKVSRWQVSFQMDRQQGRVSKSLFLFRCLEKQVLSSSSHWGLASENVEFILTLVTQSQNEWLNWTVFAPMGLWERALVFLGLRPSP